MINGTIALCIILRKKRRQCERSNKLNSTSDNDQNSKFHFFCIICQRWRAGDMENNNNNHNEDVRHSIQFNWIPALPLRKHDRAVPLTPPPQWKILVCVFTTHLFLFVMHVPSIMIRLRHRAKWITFKMFRSQRNRRFCCEAQLREIENACILMDNKMWKVDHGMRQTKITLSIEQS